MLRPSGLWFLVAIALLPRAAAAQGEPRTALLVVVEDASGGAMPGVNIRVVNLESRAAIEAVSDARGSSRVEALRPGRYRVDAAIDGFEPLARQVTLSALEPTTVTFALQPSQLAESV